MYVTADQACNEPNSESPIPAADISSQTARLTQINNDFLNGNAAVYNLVQSLGGNMPALVPGSPAPLPPLPAPASANPVYAAPGVLAAPPGPLVPSVIGGIPLGGGGINLGPAGASMVYGCNPSATGLSPLAAALAAVPSGMWIFGGLALAAALYFLQSEGAYRE